MAKMITVDPRNPRPDDLRPAAALIRAGEVVAIPTDTVYGLASDAWNASAAEKIFAVKGRSAAAPLLILVDSLEMALGCAGAELDAANPNGVSLNFTRLAQRFWPGALTIVVPASTRIPAQVTAGTGTVGIRFPNSALAAMLIEAVGGPITASSANRSGEPECRTAQAVEASIGGELPLIVDGGESVSPVPSTVIRLVEERVEILREGALTGKAISDFLRHKV